MRLGDFSDTASIDTVESPYKPRDLQAEMHRDGHRFRLGVAHRRFGKSFFCAGEILDRSLHLSRKNMVLSPPRYAFIAPTTDMAFRLGFEPLETVPGRLAPQGPQEQTVQNQLSLHD